MGQALSYIPAHFKKEMASTRSRSQHKNKDNENNIKSTKVNLKRKRAEKNDDSSSVSKENIGNEIFYQR